LVAARSARLRWFRLLHCVYPFHYLVLAVAVPLRLHLHTFCALHVAPRLRLRLFVLRFWLVTTLRVTLRLRLRFPAPTHTFRSLHWFALRAVTVRFVGLYARFGYGSFLLRLFVRFVYVRSRSRSLFCVASSRTFYLHVVFFTFTLRCYVGCLCGYTFVTPDVWFFALRYVVALRSRLHGSFSTFIAVTLRAVLRLRTLCFTRYVVGYHRCVPLLLRALVCLRLFALHVTCLFVGYTRVALAVWLRLPTLFCTPTLPFIHCFVFVTLWFRAVDCTLPVTAFYVYRLLLRCLRFILVPRLRALPLTHYTVLRCVAVPFGLRLRSVNTVYCTRCVTRAPMFGSTHGHVYVLRTAPDSFARLVARSRGYALFTLRVHVLQRRGSVRFVSSTRLRVTKLVLLQFTPHHVPLLATVTSVLRVWFSAGCVFGLRFRIGCARLRLRFTPRGYTRALRVHLFVTRTRTWVTFAFHGCVYVSVLRFGLVALPVARTPRFARMDARLVAVTAIHARLVTLVVVHTRLRFVVGYTVLVWLLLLLRLRSRLQDCWFITHHWFARGYGCYAHAPFTHTWFGYGCQRALIHACVFCVGYVYGYVVHAV